MKIFKNDNRKEMSNGQAKAFAIAGIGGMLLIATPSLINPLVAIGIGGVFTIAVLTKK